MTSEIELTVNVNNDDDLHERYQHKGIARAVPLDQSEDIYSALTHHHETHEVHDNTKQRYKDSLLFESFRQDRKFINQAADDSLHHRELRVESKKDKHKEEQAAPKWGYRHRSDTFGVSNEGETRSCLRDLIDRNTRAFREIAKHRENDEAREHRGQTVDGCDEESIPVKINNSKFCT